MKMCMEYWWNDIDRKTEVLGEKPVCQFVHHKSHMDWSRIEPGPPPWVAGDKRPEPVLKDEKENLFNTAHCYFWRSIAFFKGPRVCPFVLLVRIVCRWRSVWSIGEMSLTSGNRGSQRKTCFIAASFTTSHMDWPGMEPSPLQCEAGD
jgi:hypothetical protein